MWPTAKIVKYAGASSARYGSSASSQAGQWLRILRKLENRLPAPQRGHLPRQPRHRHVQMSARSSFMPPRWGLALSPSSRPFVLRCSAMRDRTPRCAACMALAARRGMAFDALDDVDDLEQEAARGDVGLGQFQPQSVAQAERLAGPLAHEHLAAFVVAEELLAERPDGDKPVGTAGVECREQAEAGDAGDAAGEGGADVGRHEGRDIAVHGATFRRNGAPLAHGK